MFTHIYGCILPCRGGLTATINRSSNPGCLRSPNCRNSSLRPTHYRVELQSWSHCWPERDWQGARYRPRNSRQKWPCPQAGPFGSVQNYAAFFEVLAAGFGCTFWPDFAFSLATSSCFTLRAMASVSTL